MREPVEFPDPAVVLIGQFDPVTDVCFLLQQAFADRRQRLAGPVAYRDHFSHLVGEDTGQMFDRQAVRQLHDVLVGRRVHGRAGESPRLQGDGVHPEVRRTALRVLDDEVLTPVPRLRGSHRGEALAQDDGRHDAQFAFGGGDQGGLLSLQRRVGDRPVHVSSPVL